MSNLNDDYDNQVAIAALTAGLGQTQAFRDKPVKLLDSGSDIAAANRINTGARLRGSNTIASIDKNGRVVITGGRGITTGYETGVEGIAPAGFTSTSRPSGERSKLTSSIPPTGRVQQDITGIAAPSEHFLSEMKRIDDIQDPKEKFFAVAQLRGAAEETIAKFRGQADKQASLEFKVSELEQALRTNEAADRNDPNYWKVKADSKITQNVRHQYDAALSASRARADTIYTSNPEAAKLRGIIDPFLEYTMKNLARQETKADDREAKAEALAAQFGTGHLELAGLIAPGADPVQTAAREYNNPQFREAAMAMNTPEDLVPLALGPKNAYARQGVIHKQAVLLGGTEDKNSSEYKIAHAQAEGDFRAMQDLVKNSTNFTTAMETYYPVSEKRNKILADYTTLDKSKVKEREAFRATMAPILLSKAKEADFLGNVAGWGSDSVLGDPTLAISSVYKNVRVRAGAGAPISLTALAAGIRELPDKGQQAKARDELLQVGRAALQRQASGVYGRFGDGLDLETAINTALSDTILSDFFGNIAGKAAFGGATGLAIGALPTPLAPITALGGAAIGTGAGAVVGTAESIYNLLNKENQ